MNKTNDSVLLRLEDISAWFPLRRNMKEIVKRERRWIKAVDGVSFIIRHREILGLVGESGCGKTTIARLIMKLIKPTSGKVFFDNRDVTSLHKKEEKRYREQVQMIFQDPYAAMNPRFRIRKVLDESLRIHCNSESRKSWKNRISQALEGVRLIPANDYLTRFPHMLSGGQRQRAAIARALILMPRLIIADEPVSMIDLSTRAEILSMMKELQKKHSLSFLYITHDLSTARYFADRIAVMYLGKIIEYGKADKVISDPYHPYTKALIASVCEPVPGGVDRFREIPVKGEIPPSSRIPPGCRFHPRCIYALPECKVKEPVMNDVEVNHGVACHVFG